MSEFIQELKDIASSVYSTEECLAGWCGGYNEYTNMASMGLNELINSLGDNATRMLEIGILQDELTKLGFYPETLTISGFYPKTKDMGLELKRYSIDYMIYENEVCGVYIHLEIRFTGEYVWSSRNATKYYYKSSTWKDDLMRYIKELLNE